MFFFTCYKTRCLAILNTCMCFLPQTVYAYNELKRKQEDINFVWCANQTSRLRNSIISLAKLS